MLLVLNNCKHLKKKNMIFAHQCHIQAFHWTIKSPPPLWRCTGMVKASYHLNGTWLDLLCGLSESFKRTISLNGLNLPIQCNVKTLTTQFFTCINSSGTKISLDNDKSFFYIIIFWLVSCHIKKYIYIFIYIIPPRLHNIDLDRSTDIIWF